MASGHVNRANGGRTHEADAGGAGTSAVCPSDRGGVEPSRDQERHRRRVVVKDGRPSATAPRSRPPIISRSRGIARGKAYWSGIIAALVLYLS
jgi:hypothetical protein